jgi:hypothetical protein
MYRIEESINGTTEADTFKFEIWRSNFQFNQVISPSKAAISNQFGVITLYA